MRALVYHGPGRKSWDEIPDPVIQDATDVIVGVDTLLTNVWERRPLVASGSGLVLAYSGPGIE